MKSTKIFLIVVSVMGIVAFLSQKLSASRPPKDVKGTIYDFKIKNLDGEEVDFKKFKGKYLLIVNTASKCGYTYQYQDLQRLHENYGDKVVVLGFPANNFLWQEPGSNSTIASFCKKNYGVTFTMFEKISVKGNDQHPLYNWLESKSGERPSWNFCKYLIDRSGNIIGFFPPGVKPMDKEITDKLL
jgi:glutathione peroxidase